MSEIIASIYAKMEATGLSEGILFIDEINCVSETLAPTMLQFLQCKTFGNQAVPAGWVIVAAGNPPEYNKSVRDFDIVTLDRVRRMDIEPDLPVWKDYARAAHIHSAILLESKKSETGGVCLLSMTNRGQTKYCFLDITATHEGRGTMVDVSEERQNMFLFL